MRLTNSLIAALLLCFSIEASAQWTKVPDPNVPRTRDGKPNLTAKAPKGRDGKPDLSGVWLADPDPQGKPSGIEQMVFSKFFVNIAAELRPEDLQLQPWAAEVFKTRLQGGGKDSPIAHCKPTGLPTLNFVPVPFKIVQAPQLILTLYEENTVFRQIFMDGRQPVKDPEPRYMGYSVGKWEGDTLVVDTRGFN